MKPRNISTFNIFGSFALLVSFVVSAVMVTPAYAAGIIVTTSADNTTTDGFCSLREAITNANNDLATYPNCPAGSGTDTITIPANSVITLVGSELPVVTSSIIINGVSSANTNGSGTVNVIIQANAFPNIATYRIFEVSNTGNLTIDNLTVRNGKCASSCSGGGILNQGSLTVNHSVFSDNYATAFGGGIVSTGTVTITNSIFSGNSAFIGAGIDNLGGLMNITNSTFSNNSVISGGLAGGGLASSGTLNVTNSTFSGNSAPSVSGGGIYRDSGTVTLQNTIVNNNTGGNCAGTITNGGHNIDSGTSCGWSSVNGSMSNTDPLLGSLAFNGGPTKTFALLAGSPAINAGDDTICDDNPGPNNLDQRGEFRPQGAHCDIGSYEFKTYAAGMIVNSNTDGTFVDLDLNSTCDLREAITNANNNLTSYPDCAAGSGTDTITFASNYTITLVNYELPWATSAIIINGNGVLNTIIRAETGHRVFGVGGTGNLTLDNLAVQNGSCNGFSCTEGGGIYNSGALTLTNCSLSGNNADMGGGIFNDGAGSILSVTNCSFSGNSANNGGGLAGSGTLNVTNSTFSGNSASFYGGGIYNGGTLTVTKSTFSGNGAPHGGGIANEGSLLSVTNSSFSGNNSPTSQGSDIYNGPTAATVTNSTFSGSLHGSIQNTSGTVTLKNSIVTSSTGANCSGTITNGGHNIESGASCGWGTGSGSMSNTDPLLKPLAANGGFTQTFALQAGSPAINAGDDAICAAAPVNHSSQNGITRPVGSHCDIGSFEVPYNLFLPLILR